MGFWERSLTFDFYLVITVVYLIFMFFAISRSTLRLGIAQGKAKLGATIFLVISLFIILFFWFWLKPFSWQDSIEFWVKTFWKFGEKQG